MVLDAKNSRGQKLLFLRLGPLYWLRLSTWLLERSANTAKRIEVLFVVEILEDASDIRPVVPIFFADSVRPSPNYFGHLL